MTIATEIIATVTALRRYASVLLALLLREVEKRRQAPFTSTLSLLEPVTLIALLSFVNYFMGRQKAPLGSSPVLFFATGFFAFYFFIYISQRMKSAITPSRGRFPIEQRLDHIFVHIVLKLFDYAILGILIFGTIYIIFSHDAIPASFGPIAFAGVAIVMLGFGWGILMLVLGTVFPPWAHIFPAVSRTLMIFSGVFFVADFLPPSTRYVLSFNPLLHAIMLFRKGFYPSYPAYALDERYLMYCAIGSVVFGLVLERASRRSAQR